MTNDQETQLLGSLAALCRCLGADKCPDQPPPKQTLHGLAFLVARMMKEPDRIKGLAALACRDYATEGNA